MHLLRPGEGKRSAVLRRQSPEARNRCNMTALLENHKEAIAELCRKSSVQRLFALGSAIGDAI